VHRTTLLRLVIGLPEPQITAAPEVVGAGDFALRRGHVEAAIVADAAGVQRCGLGFAAGDLVGQDEFEEALYHRLIADGTLSGGIACDDGATAHFTDERRPS
jgi:hypothetical protein